MRWMKDKYEQVIELVYDITKHHVKEGGLNGDAFAVLEDVLEYVQDQVSKNIFENYERNLFKIKA